MSESGWHTYRNLSGYQLVTPEEEFEGETDRIVSWRLKRLLDMGAQREEAENVAERLDVDLHQIEQLVARGCDIDMAIAIVA